jgi:hypothetical protein
MESNKEEKFNKWFLVIVHVIGGKKEFQGL